MLRSSLLTLALLIPAHAGLAGDAEDLTARSEAFVSAYNSGDAGATAGYYTEDGSVMPPGAPVFQGREAVAEFWQGAIDAGFVELDLTPTEWDVQGETAIEVGDYTGAVEGEAKQGKYIVVWKKTDGDWFMHRDIWNDTPAE